MFLKKTVITVFLFFFIAVSGIFLVAVTDEGGYHSAHALWALTFLRDKGCRRKSEVAKAMAELSEELRKAQDAAGPLETTRDIDLFAERLLMLRLAGSPAEALPRGAAACFSCLFAGYS